MKKNEKEEDGLQPTGLTWKQIQDEKNWDDFLAWCIEQENTTHE